MNGSRGPGLRLRMPSPALTVACIALAVALSGAGYAAVALPRNSVGTPQLKRNAVKTAKVAPNTLRGVDINEATLGTVPNAANAANAADAGLLDNLDSTAFYRTGGFALYASDNYGAPLGPDVAMTRTFDLPRAGRLWVTGHVIASVTCPAGGCGTYYGLAVDGTVLEGSVRRHDGAASTTVTRSIDLFGGTAALAAGPHTVEIRRGTNFGAPTAASDSDHALGAIAIGD